MASKVKPISEAALTVLSTGTTDGELFVINGGQLDRKIYTEVNTVLEALGGKWNRKAKGHLFDADPTDRIEDAILLRGVERPADFGYFPTPPAFADTVIQMAALEPGMRCLEPSAGSGNLATRMAAIVGWERVTMVELQERLAADLRARFPEATTLDGDFLELDNASLYFDRVVMNPPFAKQQDIAHVRHAFTFLKPGGRLVSIMAAGAEFREDHKATEFRDLVTRYGSMRRNPDGTFLPSGTGVHTVTVVLDRPQDAR